MTVRKKRSSPADVLRQEMQQPLVIPERSAAPSNTPPTPPPTPTPTTTNTTDMTPPNNDDAATIAQLKAAQEKEAKQQQQQLEAVTKELKEAQEKILKLVEQGQSNTKQKSAAIVKQDTSRSNASITARPTESREETARRRANTDIGWLD